MSKSSNQQHTGRAAIATPVAIEGGPDLDGLKAERIQEALVIEPKVISRLKAERIQLGIQGLPGWTLQRGGITRTFELADKREVARLLQYVAELSHDGEMPELHVRRDQVTFVLPLVDDGSLAKPLFEMAQSLEAGA